MILWKGCCQLQVQEVQTLHDMQQVIYQQADGTHQVVYQQADDGHQIVYQQADGNLHAMVEVARPGGTSGDGHNQYAIVVLPQSSAEPEAALSMLQLGSSM